MSVKKTWTQPVVKSINLNAARNGSKTGSPDGVKQHTNS